MPHPGLLASKLNFACLSIPLVFLTAAHAPAQGATILHHIDGTAAYDKFGTSVSAVGDIDGDGFDDFAVGAPNVDDGNRLEIGRVEVFSGRDHSVLYTWDGDDPFDLFGSAVCGAGDVNNDGVPDVIVGALRDDHVDINGTPLVDCGMARVFSGADGGALYTFYGDSNGDEFGTSVSGAGDVDSDGFDDVIVGAPWDDKNNRADSGSAYVYSGLDGSLLYRRDGDSWNDHFGNSVSNAGDVDNDGYGDFIVGAPWDDNTFSKAGSARVFSGRLGSILYTFNGDGAGYELGWSVTYLGDVTGDGHDDLFVGQPENKVNGDDAGSVRVYSGFDGTVLWTELGQSAYEYYGLSIGAGDIDGDGVPDLIVGSFRNDVRRWDGGACFVYSGATFQLIYTVYGDSNYDFLGLSVAIAGDVNGDGFGDVLAGIPGDDNLAGADAGSARVYCGFPSQPATSTYGVGCPAGQELLLTYSGTPRFGQILNIDLSGGPSGTSIGWLVFGFHNGAPYPLDLSVLGLPGCTQYQSADEIATVLLSNGSASLPISIPSTIAPCGLRFYNQGVALDLTGGGFRFSNAGEVVFTY